MAGWNLEIAQHRDRLRYAKLRSGAYLPKIKRYEVGDYVYVKYRTKPDMLQPDVRPEILRVLQVRPGKGGQEMVLRLQGADGMTVDEHFSNCVPCHLPIEEGQLKFGRAAIDYPCQACGFPDDGENIIRCDGCDKGWHLYCLDPPLLSVPQGDWFCDQCSSSVRARLLQPGSLLDTSSGLSPSVLTEVDPDLLPAAGQITQQQQQQLQGQRRRSQNNGDISVSAQGSTSGASKAPDGRKSLRWKLDSNTQKNLLSDDELAISLRDKWHSVNRSRVLRSAQKSRSEINGQPIPKVKT